MVVFTGDKAGVGEETFRDTADDVDEEVCGVLDICTNVIA